MKKLIGAIVLVSILSVFSYRLTMHFFPNYVYHKYKTKSILINGAEKYNTLKYLLAPDENSRLVVKPNPDFAYGTAFYKLDDGPVRVKGKMPDSVYWSVALYQPNTVNFYVKNDMQYLEEGGNGGFDIVLGKEDPQMNGAEYVHCPTKEGFLLIRLLVTDKSEENLARTKTVLNSLEMESLNIAKK